MRPTKTFWNRIGLGLVLVAVLAIWVRNRDILSDLYDYSSVIAAAGKIEAGLRPYVDFRSTMQSAGYALNHAVEIVVGANYEALTWGGLAWSAGGVLVLFALWRKDLGERLAVLAAGAVGLAGLSQHVVIFYNPIGLLCLAVVVAAMPPLCRGQSLWSWRGLALGLALVLGGTNKANFQGLAVALAGAMVLCAAVAGQLSWRQLAIRWGGLVVAGIILPVALELAWTGATLDQWFYNVVELAEERVGFVALVFAPESYLKPTYDLHYHILFKPLHTVGVAVTLLAAIAAWRARSGWGWRMAVAVLAMGGAMGGVLLTVTNVESIALTSQGTLMAAVAVAAMGGVAASRWVQTLLGVAAALWIGVGGWAAWMGSRVLYARPDTDRSGFVRLEHAPPALRYLEGVRLTTGTYDSLQLVVHEVDRIVAQDGDARHVLFGDTLEWLERAYPESIMEGMPVWYHVGTALRNDDGPWLIEHFEKKGITHFFTHPAWEIWPADFQAYLDANYKEIPLGVLRVYELRASSAADAKRATPLPFAPGDALEMAERTGSSLHLGTTRTRGTEPGLFSSSLDGFFGATGSWTWEWLNPLRDLNGTFMVMPVKGAPHYFKPVEIRARIIADAGAEQEVLWECKLAVAAIGSGQRVPWTVRAAGRKLTLEVEMTGAAAKQVAAGWRDLRVIQVGELGDDVSVPPSLVGGAAGTDATRRDVAGIETWFRGELQMPGPAGLEPAAAREVWGRPAQDGGEWTATWSIEPAAVEGGSMPILMLYWTKGGRLDLLTQLAPPVTEGEFTVKGWLPAPGGWMGVVVRPVDAGRPLNAKLKLLRWSP